MITCSIQHILRAMHRPDVGQYGACTRCAHGDTTGQRCSHEYAGKHGLPSAIMRGPEGACRDGSLHEYAALPHHHPAQQALAI